MPEEKNYHFKEESEMLGHIIKKVEAIETKPEEVDLEEAKHRALEILKTADDWFTALINEIDPPVDEVHQDGGLAK